MRMHRVLATALAAGMLAGMLPAALAAAPQGTKSTAQAQSELAVELQKTAGSLTTGRNSTVTLGISAPVSSTPVAVEFVLDATSSLFSTGDQVMIQSWAETIRDTMADKNVYPGVTIFTNHAETVYEMGETLTAGSLTDSEISDIITAGAAMVINPESTGTNVQSGIRAGLADLNANAPAGAKKYMVLITDGGSYWWMNGDTPANNTMNGSDQVQNNDAAEADRASGTYALASLVDELLPAVAAGTISAEPANYDTTNPEAMLGVIAAMGEDYTNFEKGVAFAAAELDTLDASNVDLITVGYDYYAEDPSLDALTALAGEFIDYASSQSVYSVEPASLADTAASLGDIMDAIYGAAVDVVIPAGSVITDEIGRSADGASEVYDFSLNTNREFTLYVGDAVLGSGTLSNNSITFVRDGADFMTIQYYPNGSAENSEEHFTATLHQDLHRSERLSLTYTVHLDERDTTEGTHYVETNQDAWLTLPNGGDSYFFPDPVLGYRIIDDGPEGGSEVIVDPDDPDGGGGDTTIDDGETPLGPLPDLNTEDHFAYIIGRDDGGVHPEASITRAEVATIFFRMLTDDSRDQLWTTSNTYSDVDPAAWYNNAVSTLTHSGVITGKPGNYFDPDASITRAEFATIAVRFFGGDYEGEDLFTDITGHWANKYINRAAVLGLINGRGDGTFDPDADITRAEAMTIVNRTLGRKPDANHLLPDMITWPDNQDTTAWYYADVQEATNSHDFDVIEINGEQKESWTTLLPVRDWAALEREWSNAHSSSNPGDVMSDLTIDPNA